MITLFLGGCFAALVVPIAILWWLLWDAERRWPMERL